MIDAEKAERIREQMTAAAFTAWQLGAGEKGGSFRSHLRKMGLVQDEENTPLTPEQKQAAEKRGLDIAEKITAAVKAGKVR